jgi:CheY-like chemotaxis protein
VGQGAQFWFDTPLKAALQAAPEPMLTPADGTSEALRILVVDDNAINRMVACLQLQKCWPQAQVVTADSAAEALSLLTESVFDVALVDMVMPEMDGMQLTQAIRQRLAAQAAHMPIIALTDNTNPVDRQRCLDAGMCDVLSKPMDLLALKHCVNVHVQLAKRAAA